MGVDYTICNFILQVLFFIDESTNIYIPVFEVERGDSWNFQVLILVLVPKHNVDLIR